MSGRPSGTRGGPMYEMTPAQRAAANGAAANGAAANGAAANGAAANGAAANGAAANGAAGNTIFSKIDNLWKQYCNNKDKVWMLETKPPTNEKVLKFLQDEVSNPSDQPFKSSRELQLMFSSGGKRTCKRKTKAKKTKKHRR